MAYRGKHPTKVRSVYSATLLVKRCIMIELNNGLRFIVSPKEGSERRMPELGQTLEQVREQNIAIEVTKG